MRLSPSRCTLLACALLAFQTGGLAADPLNMAAAVASARDGDLDAALSTLAELPPGVPADALAAAIGFRLRQQSTDDRYEALQRWTIDRSTDPPTVRAATAACGVAAPPPAFAKVLRKRPTDDFFAPPSVGPINGLLSTAYQLATAADAVGRLRELRQTIADLPGPAAEHLRLISALVDDRNAADADLTDQLSNAAENPQTQPADQPLRWLAVAAVSLQNQRPRVGRQIAAAVQPTLAEIAPSLANEVTRRISPPNDAATGLGDDWIVPSDLGRWQTSDDHVVYRGAPGGRVMYRYPVTGDFQFILDNVADANAGAMHPVVGHPIPINGGRYWRGHDRLTVDVDSAGRRVLLGGHRVGEGEPCPGNPFLGLWAAGTRGMARHPKLRGRYEIPRSVELQIDPAVGWQTTQSGDMRFSQFHRPLLPGETLRYETTGGGMMHPALGNVAFVIEPGGVSLQWLAVDDADWTGLAGGDRLIEPLARRGPNPLLLAETHSVTLSIADQTLTVSLGETMVYERRIDDLTDRRLGLVHWGGGQEPGIASITLSGDWPRTLPSSLLPAITDPEAIADSIAATDWHHVMASTDSMTPAKRYEALLSWVLPSGRPPRLGGYHYPTDPADPGDPPGAAVASPALRLIDAADQTGQINDLRTRIDAIDEDDLISRRGRSALLTLLSLHAGDPEAALPHYETLYQAMIDSGPMPLDQRWPEYLVADAAMAFQSLHTITSDLVAWMDPKSHGAEGNQMATQFLRILLTARASLDGGPGQPADVALQQWHTVSRPRTTSRGPGRPSPRWSVAEGRVRMTAPQDEDWLLFCTPMLDDYSIACDLGRGSYAESQLFAGGLWSQIKHWDNQVILSTRDRPDTAIIPAEKLQNIGQWVHVRVDVQDAVRRMFIAGQLVDTRPVPDSMSPWIGFRNSWNNAGEIRNVVISGDPEIPRQLNLSGSLVDHWQRYDGHLLADGSWTCADDEIRHPKSQQAAGSADEQWLYALRPMLEDGDILYDFFYEPGVSLVHPALDRWAMILSPDGVGLHVITDDGHGPPGEDPAAIRPVPEAQRGDRPLSLRPGWNQARLSIRGDTLSLRLGGELIYQSEIPPTNRRHFGLFHFADQTAAAVRSVRHRGNWPTSLTPPARQELVDPFVRQLDLRRNHLIARFEHDFAADGLPADLFELQPSLGAFIEPKPDGMRVTIPGFSGWNQSMLALKLRAVGDFDITAEFSDFQTDASKAGHLMLAASHKVDGELSGRVERVDHADGKSTLSSTKQLWRGPNDIQQSNHQVAWHGTAGTLRLARRGDVVHMLMSPSASQETVYIGSHPITAAATGKNGIRLTGVTFGAGVTAVTIKNLRVRAEKLLAVDDGVAPGRIYTAAADGTGTRQITQTIGELGSHGSPDISPDGSLLIFDTNAGSTVGAHLFAVRRDGTGLQDLGPGCLPSIAPDSARVATSVGSGGLEIIDIADRSRVQVTDSGWNLRFLPTGNQVSYHDYDAPRRSYNIIRQDLSTGQKRSLLTGDDAARYRQIFWAADWSPDGNHYGFVGRRADGDLELAVLSNGPQPKLTVLRTGNTLGYAIAWHPSGKQLAYIRPDVQTGLQRAFVIDLDQPEQETLFPGQPTGQDVNAAVWSPDGNWVAYASRTPAEYVSGGP